MADNAYGHIGNLEESATMGPTRPTTQSPSIGYIREVLQSFATEQLMLQWYSHIIGERSVIALTFSGREWIFTNNTLSVVKKVLTEAQNDLERESLNYLVAYLASDTIRQNVSKFDDELHKAVVNIRVSVPWIDKELTYNDLNNAINKEKDPNRLGELQELLATVLDTQINPILAKKMLLAHKCSLQLGFDSYRALAGQVHQVDLNKWIPLSEEFGQRTQASYLGLLHEAAGITDSAGQDSAVITKNELVRIVGAPELDDYFPAELAVPIVKYFIEGIGLQLKTSAGTNIVIDQGDHPQKLPRACCFPIEIPNDIRISVPHGGGLTAFRALFHEIGHAIHFGNIDTSNWEMKYTGPRGLSEGIAMTFEFIWADPIWLKRYSNFVSLYNQKHGSIYPILSDEQIKSAALASRLRIMNICRLVNLCSIPFEMAIHGKNTVEEGPPGSPSDKALYVELYERATSLHLEADSRARYLSGIDDMMYCVSYGEATTVVGMLHQYFQANYGRNWYLNRDIGSFLCKNVFASGHLLKSNELAQILNQNSISFKHLESFVFSSTAT